MLIQEAQEGRRLRDLHIRHKSPRYTSEVCAGVGYGLGARTRRRRRRSGNRRSPDLVTALNWQKTAMATKHSSEGEGGVN